MLVDSHLEDLNRFILHGLKTTNLRVYSYFICTILHRVCKERFFDGDFRKQEGIFIPLLNSCSIYFLQTFFFFKIVLQVLSIAFFWYTLYTDLF